MPLNYLLPNGQNGKLYVICKKWLVIPDPTVDKWRHKLYNIHSTEHYAFLFNMMITTKLNIKVIKALQKNIDMGKY